MRFSRLSRIPRMAAWCACAWLATTGLAAAADDAQALKLGQELFSKSAVPACALCHTMKNAGTEGAIGPNLDELKPDAKRVAQALRNGIGQMPSYKGSLSDEQIAALALYVAKATGAAK